MNEQMKILEMLKDGKITPEQADKLLDKLAKLDAEPDEDDFVVDDPRGYAASAQAVKVKIAKGKKRKFFCIKINTQNGKNINLRLPMAVAKAGVKLSALLPESAMGTLKEKGVNLDELSNLKGDDLTEALEALDIKINTDEGDSINIFTEE
jgi:hypothetical protein